MKRAFHIFSIALILSLLISTVGLGPTPVQAAAAWEHVGLAGFSPGGATYISLKFENGLPYVAFQDWANAKGASVMKFNGTEWVNVGAPGFSAGEASLISFAFGDGIPFVAYRDGANANKVTVKEFDGTEWVNVGAPGFSVGAASLISLALDGDTPYVAFKDMGNNWKLSVMKFDSLSGNWVNVGPAGFSGGAVDDISLTLDGSTLYVAYSKYINGFYKTNVRKFDTQSGTWVSVGPADFSGGLYLSLVVDGSTPYLAFQDQTNGWKASVLKFDASSGNWVNVGPAGFAGPGTGFLSFLVDHGTPYIAFQDRTHGDRATVLKFNGRDWVSVGPLGFSAGIAVFTSLAVDGGTPYLAFQEGAHAGKVSVMKFVGGALPSATFEDVATDHWAWQYVERLYNAGITGGCGNNPLQYCPESTVTRAQMAVFLERGMNGFSYSPPVVGGGTGFGDVATDHWAGAWIKQLAADGITGGCGSGNYCPDAAVTRAQMAVFLLKAKHGAAYAPPAAGGSTGFTDVDPTHWAGAWIKQLVAEGITAGCGSGAYCPESPVTRAQMAVFLVRTFNLP